MFFLRAMQAPVIVTVGDRVLTIPKFTLDDSVAWASEIQAERDASALEGMDDTRKREFRMMYPSIPPDIGELRKLLLGIPGAKRVVFSCLSKAKDQASLLMTSEEVNSLIQANGAARLYLLAKELSDLYEDISTDPNQKTATGTTVNSTTPSTDIKPTA